MKQKFMKIFINTRKGKEIRHHYQNLNLKLGILLEYQKLKRLLKKGIQETGLVKYLS